MARKPRIHFEKALYHAIVRGNGGQSIFLDDADRQIFYAFLEKSIQRFEYQIVAFCLMSNHAHLAVRVGREPLAHIMQSVCSRYARKFNRRHGRTGHLFQGRYWAQLVQEEPYFKVLVRYIHRNPMRAGLIERIDEWRWSGHRALLGRERLPWFDAHHTLSHFSRNRSIARLHYRLFVEGRGCDDDEWFIKGSEADSRIAGNAGSYVEFMGSGEPGVAPKVTLSQILDAVCLEYGISPAEMRCPCRKRIMTEARSIVGYLAMAGSVATLTRVSQELDRTTATMSNGVLRMRHRMASEAHTRDRVRLIARSLGIQVF